jgi:hypothetical protein
MMLIMMMTLLVQRMKSGCLNNANKSTVAMKITLQFCFFVTIQAGRLELILCSWEGNLVECTSYSIKFLPLHLPLPCVVLPEQRLERYENSALVAPPRLHVA